MMGSFQLGMASGVLVTRMRRARREHAHAVGDALLSSSASLFAISAQRAGRIVEERICI